MKVFVVVDHVCEADIVIGVFSDRAKAQNFVDENSWPLARTLLYETLEIMEFELDGMEIAKIKRPEPSTRAWDILR